MSRPGELVWTPERLAIARAVYAEKGSHAAAARVLTSLGYPTNRDAVEGAFRRHGKTVLSERPDLTSASGGRVSASEPPSTQKSTKAPSGAESGGLDWEDAAVPSPVPVPRKLRKALVMSDLHIPRMSKVAWDLATQVALDVRPDTVIIDGDFLDAAALSSYAKDPQNTPRFADEIAAGNDYLDEIDSWGAPNRWHVGGNHLAGRWKRHIWEKTPALAGLVSFEGLLRFEERGWKCVDYKDHLFFGSALISHELGRGGATAMTRTRDDIHNDCVIGHVHRAGVHWRGDVMGRTFFGASFGWMGDLDAVDYAYKASVATTHVLGFGLLTLDEETGQTFVEAVPIINGRCVAHGRLYVSKVECPKPVRRVA